MQIVSGRYICNAREQCIKLLLGPSIDAAAAPLALLTLKICDVAIHVEHIDPEPTISRY